MSVHDPTISISWQGLSLRFWPSGALQINQTLFVADLHLGKEIDFWRRGHALPPGGTESTLQSLSADLSQTEATELIILGDLWHSAQSRQAPFGDMLRQHRQDWPELQIWLVPGNHDRGNLHLDEFRIQRWPEEARWNGLYLVHAPGDPQPSLSGHLHPAIRMPSAPRRQERFRCFARMNGGWILPAYGELTGGVTLQLHLLEDAVLCLDTRVMRIDLPAVIRHLTDRS